MLAVTLMPQAYEFGGLRGRAPPKHPQGMAEIPAVSVAGKDGRTCAAFVPRSNQGYTDASAPVAQGIERAPPEREVAGSIPAGRIISRSVLEASAGSWRDRRFSGADYVDTIRSDLNQRLRRLGLE
jgi:hypothetical protein